MAAMASLSVPPRPEDWFLQQVELRCGVHFCPPQVGVLFFVTKVEHLTEQDGARLHLERCTATLIGRDLILTNGHCDHLPTPGYFITGYGSKKKVVRIKNLVFKRYTPGDTSLSPPANALAPDVAIFELDQSIEDVLPLKIASGPQLVFDHLEGYTINEDSAASPLETKSFRVDLLKFSIHPDESIFPYSMTEAPNLIYGFDCKTVYGNSGTPLFYPGNSDIQAILQGVGDLMLATNVRCVNFPGVIPQSCLPVSKEDIRRRYSLRHSTK